ncbi:hypothetical protein AVEN_265530-1 [Araneus ventricosus]|uniref:Uncharacterized protein n=1 Tax=Araneus ventricosus TaxID=182803 RepID=A0A4Y2VCR9_ARAVE|nr:hypothetical protein AVEN_265530-1 [Araneus ventricosus]
MNEFLRVVSEVFEDFNSRLEQFETIKSRLEKLEAAQVEPSYNQVVGPPLFSVGAQGSSLSTSVALEENRIPRVRTKKGRPPPSLAPAAVPPEATPLAPSVSAPLRVPVPPKNGQTAPVRVQSQVQLKPRPESPTVIVKPLGDSLDSSLALKRLLEENISPKQLGLRVLACLPAAENGMLVKLQQLIWLHYSRRISKVIPI